MILLFLRASFFITSRPPLRTPYSAACAIHIIVISPYDKIISKYGKEVGNKINEDIRKKTSLPSGTFNFVITNPPYSDHDMPSPNESKKLAHNHQDFDLTSWLSFCLKMLKPKGYLLVINRAEALNEIITAIDKKAGSINIVPFYSKVGQDAKRVAIIAQKTAKGITKILPPFYTHNDDGSYTDKAQSILRLGKGYFD